jgi:transcriptional regulator with XRE-family HTH domain
MATSRDVRRTKFGSFVRAALEGARIQRGWTVAAVLDATGVGKSTLYRWLNAEWVDDPQPAKVRDFCDGLDIPVDQAFRILWPAKADKPETREPAPMDPGVEELLRLLNDPRVPETDKAYIRANLRFIADFVSSKRRERQPRRRKVS